MEKGDRDDRRGRTRRERETAARSRIRVPGVLEASAHPVAWSTIRAVNGWPFFGVTLKESAQWPTMTSAGAGWE